MPPITSGAAWKGVAGILLAILAIAIGFWLLRELGRRLDPPKPVATPLPMSTSPPYVPATSPARRSPPTRPQPTSSLGVVIVHVGLDAKARRAVQSSLTTLATALSLDGAEGRLNALRATLALLDAHGASVAYEGARTIAPLPQVEARRVFTQQTADLRARYRYELVRRDAATPAMSAPALGDPSPATHPGATPPLRARPEEGEGFVVVSIVVAARGILRSSGGYDPTVASLVHVRAEDLVAFEVIWSPAAEEDRMSSLELEALYPELSRTRSHVGRVRCVCGVPYAAELLRCPSCGRPVEEALVGV